MDANSVMSPKVNEAVTEIDHSKDSQSQVPYIVSVLTVACFFSTAVVLLRLYTRLRILRTFGADDMMMGVAQVLTLGSAAAIYFGTSCPALASDAYGCISWDLCSPFSSETAYGLGRHVWLLTNYAAYMSVHLHTQRRNR